MIDLLSVKISCLTYWGRVTHICTSKIIIIVSDNGLLPGRPQCPVWKNARILLIAPLGIHFIEILIEIGTFSLKKIRLKQSFAKWCPFRLGLNELMTTMNTINSNGAYHPPCVLYKETVGQYGSNATKTIQSRCSTLNTVNRPSLNYAIGYLHSFISNETSIALVDGLALNLPFPHCWHILKIILMNIC